MPSAKICPNCFRSYPDLTLNFCLDDGRPLSDSFEFSLPDREAEVETQVRQRPIKRTGSVDENWKYQKTARTMSEHPVSDAPSVSDRPRSKWTSSDELRQITFEVTGLHTFHAQENLEILRKHLNEQIDSRFFTKTTWQLGKGHFYTKSGRMTFDFQPKANPKGIRFLLEVITCVGRTPSS